MTEEQKPDAVLQARIVELEAEIKTLVTREAASVDAGFALQARNAALEEALKPFAACVYDNGDLTVEMALHIGDFTRAYFVHRAALPQREK
jgi:hypothetical protein